MNVSTIRALLDRLAPRQSVASVALIGRFDTALTKCLADFRVFPKYRGYPRVEAQRADRLFSPFLTGFSEALTPFLL